MVKILLLFSLLGSIFSLGGNLLIMLKKKSGWIVWIAGNICWLLYNFLGEINWPMVGMYVAYFIINVCGFIAWNKKDFKSRL